MQIALDKSEIGGLVARVPIVQGGMGVGISLSDGCRVANAGGGGDRGPGIGLLEPDVSRISSGEYPAPPT